MKDADHEVYPSAPLRFVAFEARVSSVPLLETQEGRLAIYDVLQELFPILQPGPQQQGPVGLIIEPAAQQTRMMDRSRTLGARVGPETIAVETSSYKHFNWFTEIVEETLGCLSKVALIPSLQRVGLRYTDEIRVPGVSHPKDWAPYIDERLIGPLDLVDGLTAEGHQGQTEYRINDHHLIRTRYGSIEGWSVDPNGPLAVENLGAGPYFLIDLDSFWTAPTNSFPEFSVEKTITLTKELHEPLRSLFEASITEQLRDSVFRKDPTGGATEEVDGDGN